MYGDYGHNMIAWRGGLGDDPIDIQPVASPYDYATLPDPNAPTVPMDGSAPVQWVTPAYAAAGLPTTPAISNVAVAAPTGATQLMPGPTPRIATVQPSFFTQSSLIAGVPNWMLMIGAAAVLMMSSAGGRRR